MEEIVMVANAKPAKLTPSASLFLSLREELAEAHATYNFKPDHKKGELLTYPVKSLTNLSKAIRICKRVVRHHIHMCELEREEYELSATFLARACESNDIDVFEIFNLVQVLTPGTDALIRVRYLVCSREDLKRAEVFCNIMCDYLQKIESDEMSEHLAKASRAISERPW